MGYIVGDRKERWDWVLSIADISAPTVAEINAGVRISTNMLSATGFAPDTASVDVSGIEDDFAVNVPGRRSFGTPTMVFKKQSGTDTVYNALAPDADGFLVRRRSVDVDTAYAAAQKVEVYPAAVGEPSVVDFEPNAVERFTVPFFITARPDLRAVVAA
ncbi:MAG TPA: hypothetical protein VFX60_19355 [Micromonospora sp.]|nr:hypothetical protein [Micromonospora sp.]